jgi:hypothetical protein
VKQRLGKNMIDLVECHSDFEYAERPTALYWQGQHLVITRVLESRRMPEGKAFRVITQDDRVFELIYMEALDEWRIQEQ